MKESITVYSRPVSNTTFLPENLQPQHTFLIYTNSQGEQFIYRGGPGTDYKNYDGNMITDNLKVYSGKYDKNISPDWVDPQILSTYSPQTLKQGDDLSSLWNKLSPRAEHINQINLDYEPLNKNCNAVTSDGVTVMGDGEMIGIYNKYILKQDLKTPGAGTDQALLTHSNTDIALSSLSSDLYSIHEKIFSVENLAYATSQLAMGAHIDDVARFVVVNTIATSAVDAGLKAILLREEFANKSLDGISTSYNQLLSDNTGLASMKAGFTVFVATAILTGGDYKAAAENASIQAIATYASKMAVNELAKHASSEAAAASMGQYAGPIAAAVTTIVSGIRNGASAEEIAVQTAIAVSAIMIGAAVSGVVMGTQIGAAIGSVIPGLGTIIGAVVGAFVGYALSSLFGSHKAPPPPPLFKIVMKDDGTGQIIYSLHDGYTIISRDSFADDAVGFFALKKQRTAVFSKKRQQGACDAVAGTSRLQAKRRKAAKCVDANSDYFLLNLKTQNQMFANDNFEMVKVNKITGGYYV